MTQNDTDVQARRRKVLDELVAEAQEHRLYDIKIEPCSCGRMPPCRHVDDPDHPEA